jgi:hypothetical protein
MFKLSSTNVLEVESTTINYEKHALHMKATKYYFSKPSRTFRPNWSLPLISLENLSQQHILGFVTSLYDYVLVKKDICD